MVSSNTKKTTLRSGFTIVELLIVIVVIGILAAITGMSYSGIQAKARDAQRVSDIETINKAIMSYYTVNGTYPGQTASPGIGGFEASTDTAGTFLEHLKNSGFLSKAPLDPLNTSTYYYGYYLYTAGWGANGCDDSRGSYYLLMVNKFESTNGAQPNSPGFSCSGRNWQGTTNSQWVTGGYER
ncbi:MAG: type II secretion system protein [Candidatus Saccharibacteria bacterium]